MNIPESKEVVIQRMSEDPRLMGHLIRFMVMGDPSTVIDEFQTAEDMATEYGAPYEDVERAAEIARARVDEDILSGRLNIL